MSTDTAGSPALATLRRVRAQQEAVIRWLRRLVPPVFVVVVAVTFTPGRNSGMAIRDMAAVLAVGGIAVGALGALTARHRRTAVRIAFAVALVASSAALMGLQPDGPGLAGLLTGLVLLVPRVPDRFPISLSVAGITCLAAAAVAVSHDSPTLALLSAIAIVGFPGMTLLARRLGQANDQAERLLIELEGTRAAQAQAAGLAERQRLAREMHDVLAHSLSGLMLQLEGARMLAAEDPSDPRLPGIIERAHHLGKSGLEEARRAIGMLRDDELPGPERLASLAAQFHEITGIPCQFTTSGQAYELPSEARLAVYRVAQEALTNITKHACPERVEMHLGYESCRTRLTVENFAMNHGTAARRRRRPRLRPDRDARAGRTARRRAHHSDDTRRLPRGVAGAGVNQPMRVLVADDQRVVREGLAMVLGLLPDVEVVGSACDGDEAVALAADLLPDVVLMDLRMPRCDGVEATRLLRERVPETTVVVLTTYADDRSVIAALRAGARGYLTKDAGGAEIRHALRQVLDNHAVIDPAVQHHVVDAIATRSPAQARRPLSSLPAGLTPREAEVLSLIATGMSNREIAEHLVVSEGTVKSHINHLLAKIDARDRAQAVAFAYQRGLALPREQPG